MTLKTNLATRPFYNVRAVHLALVLLALIVAAFTLFNVFEIVRLRGSESVLGAHATESETQAARLRADALRIRAQIDQKELAAVSAAAREANAIIDRRAFSWTHLFSELEEALPPDVRITSVQPRLELGVFKVALATEARRTEDMAEFIEALEKTGAFKNVVPLRQEVDEQGLLTIALDSLYTPRARTAEAEPAPGAPESAQ